MNIHVNFNVDFHIQKGKELLEAGAISSEVLEALQREIMEISPRKYEDMLHWYISQYYGIVQSMQFMRSLMTKKQVEKLDKIVKNATTPSSAVPGEVSPESKFIQKFNKE